MRICPPVRNRGRLSLRSSLFGLSLILAPAAAVQAGNVVEWDYPASGAAGFAVYCGTAPGKYTLRFDVGNMLSATLSSLSAGQTYYCAAAAYDSAGKEGARSNEALVSVPAPSTAVSFSVSNASGSAPLTVSFEDTTVGLTNWAWDFGDGATSTAQHPQHTYTTSGLYSVSLTGRLADGSVRQLVKPDAVSVSQTLWRLTDRPAIGAVQDNGAVNLGVRFSSTRAGYITGIRFYKDATNTGRHLANLWSASGQKLAEAAFTNETASGWQQVNFATPVKIAAGATYIASYLAPYGRYSATRDFFAATGVTSGPLRAPASTSRALNGVYAYRAVPQFPTKSSRASNYWVDVVFKPGP